MPTGSTIAWYRRRAMKGKNIDSVDRLNRYNIKTLRSDNIFVLALVLVLDFSVLDYEEEDDDENDAVAAAPRSGQIIA